MNRLIALLTIGAWALSTSVPTIAAPRGSLVLGARAESSQLAGLKRVFTFAYPSTGIDPYGALTLARDGNLYGLTSLGGSAGGGTMYRVHPGGGVQIVAGIPSRVGAYPLDGLTLGPDGLLYGATTSIAPGGYGGAIFKSTLTGTMAAVYAFDSNVIYTPGKVTFGRNGTLYGILASGPAGVASAYELTPRGPAFLTYFSDQRTGEVPAPLALGPDGNLYGAAYSHPRPYKYLYGSAYRLSPSGGRTNLAQFTPNDVIGIAPIDQLTLAPDGAFYGVTQSDKIYRVTASGTRTLVVDLNKAFPSGACASPAFPPDPAKLALGRDGRLYGATGTCVYRTTLAGAATLLAVDNGGSGTYLEMPAFGSDGNLYGNGSGSDSRSVNGFVYEVAVK